jgi:hypothetical protein
MINEPDLSVVIPPHNRAALVRDAPATIIAGSSCASFEVIAVDDGSSSPVDASALPDGRLVWKADMLLDVVATGRLEESGTRLITLAWAMAMRVEAVPQRRRVRQRLWYHYARGRRDAASAYRDGAPPFVGDGPGPD